MVARLLWMDAFTINVFSICPQPCCDPLDTRHRTHSSEVICMMYTCIAHVYSREPTPRVQYSCRRFFHPPMVIRNVFCDRCGRGFAAQSAVQNHQSQHSSQCWKTYSLLLEMQRNTSPGVRNEVDNAQSTTPSSPSSPSPPSPPPSHPPIPSSPPEVDMEIDNQLEESLSFYTEFFTGASKVFGKGETFMDLFHEDKYADMRQVNPYYPFASQAEWELASFLLKSGLSRVAVDQFLKLQFVCDLLNQKIFKLD